MITIAHISLKHKDIVSKRSCFKKTFSQISHHTVCKQKAKDLQHLVFFKAQISDNSTLIKTEYNCSKTI